MSSAVRGGCSAILRLLRRVWWAFEAGKAKRSERTRPSRVLRHGRLQPGARPDLQRPHGGLKRAALLGERVFNARRNAFARAALDDPLGLELLQALGEEAVRQVGHEDLHLGETQRSIEQDEQDGARPALPDQLDRRVVRRATTLTPRGDRIVLRGGLLGHAVIVPGDGAGASRHHAACCSRESSFDPSRGTSPARVTRLANVASATWAIASRICSSAQPASSASSCLCRGGAPSDSSSAFTKRSSVASRSSRESNSRARAISSRPRPQSRAVRCSVASPYSLPWCSATASAMRCWVAYGKAPLRSSGGRRGYERTTAGDPAST